jgi:DNA-binding transcriptional LysR family regulator
LESLTFASLRCFVEVAQQRSFRGAAQALYLSQPAVSDHVRRLERLVGTQLLVRCSGRRTVTLTQSGHVLLDKALAILGQLNELGERLEQSGPAKHCVLAIGSTPRQFTQLVQAVTERFRRVAPEVELDVRVATHHELMSRLHRRELDLVLSIGPLDVPGVDAEPICDVHGILVAPPGHRLATGPAFALRELAKERLILPPASSTSRRAFDDLLRTTGLSLQVAVESAYNDVRVKSAVEGLGIALLTAELIADRLARGELVPLNIQGFPLRYHQSMFCRREVPSPELQLLKQRLSKTEPERLVEIAAPCA